MGDDGAMRSAVDVTVTGRVQGVSFRYYAEREADRLGVAGWVRNEPDGTVAAHVEGAPGAVDGFVRWCHDGPRLAHVERVDVRDGTDEGLTSFGVR
ncbi:MAG: acylphosphatase [Nocardioides sp.]|nr:acylphosphatase [Nocardioides sp.]